MGRADVCRMLFETLRGTNPQSKEKAVDGYIKAIENNGTGLTPKIIKAVNDVFPSKIPTSVTLPTEPAEVRMARQFIKKYENAIDRGLEFNITLTSYRNMNRAKRCYYSGLELCDKTRTVDRVARTKGYIKGNVVACHRSINQVKNVLESPTQYGMTQTELLKLIKQWSNK